MNPSLDPIQYGKDDIYSAILKGDFPLCVLLWGMASASRVNLLEPNSFKNSLLHLAASNGSVEIIGFIMQMAGTQSHVLDAVNDSGETPLIRAAANGNLAAVHMLLLNGAQWKIADINGNTPVHYAIYNGHLGVTHYLLSQSNECPNLHTTSSNTTTTTTSPSTSSCCETMTMTTSKKSTENENENENDVAANCTSTDPACVDHHGNTLLHWACSGGSLPLVRYLVEQRDQDPNCVNDQGKTCLHVAASEGFENIVIYLLTMNVDKMVRDKDHRIPADLSLQNHHKNVYKILTTKMKIKCSKGRLRTRAWVMLLYSSIVWIVVSTSFFLPWYIFFSLLLVGGIRLFTKRNSHRNHHHHNPTNSFQETNSSSIYKNEISLVLHSKSVKPISTQWNPLKWLKLQHEWAIGIWFGMVVLYIAYAIGLVILDKEFMSHKKQYIAEMVICGILLMALFFKWIPLAILRSNAGEVNTYEKDLEEFLQRSALGMNALPNSCSTCMVIKPIRSKHCRVCGTCVARMDHHCVWINNCVGFLNHRSFLVFLMLHLITLFFFLVIIIEHQKHSDFCTTVSVLFKDRLFEVVLLLWGLLCFLWLTWLLIRQFNHVMKNITENEYLHKGRYKYLKDEKGAFSNGFDKGKVKNVMEFLGFSSQYVDYMKVFTNHETYLSNVVVHSPHETNKPLLEKF